MVANYISEKLRKLMNVNLKAVSVMIGFTCLISGCGQAKTQENTTLKAEPNPIQSGSNEAVRAPEDAMSVEKSVKRALSKLSPEQMEMLNKTPIVAGRYPELPEPNYGPEQGSITFTDMDSGPTIGGILTMKPAVDEEGNRVNEADVGITMYSIHWGLEVGSPGQQDDKGSGDLSGDCMGFRDLNHIVTMTGGEAGDVISWEIPSGTVVPANAVYFVGYVQSGELYNLKKCTQIPIMNLIAE